MDKQAQVEELAKILAKKRQSDINWATEVARIVIDEGYTRTNPLVALSEDEIEKLINQVPIPWEDNDDIAIEFDQKEYILRITKAIHALCVEVNK